MRDRALTRDEDRANVDRQLSVEVFKGQRLDVADDRDACVVDKDVQPAERSCRVVDRLRHRVGVGAVGLDRDGRSAGGGHFGD
jgi:hypothetical protein